MIASADLNRRARFERSTLTKDATTGAPVKTWAEVFTCYVQALDTPPSRSEGVRNGLQQARNQTTLRMRYRGDITSDMRVVLLGDTEITMQIVGGPAMIGRKDALEMVLERYSTAGADG